MSDITVNFGIDLGTTNSAISRFEPKGPKPIKSRDQEDTIPSAVHIDEDGRITVGKHAVMAGKWDTFRQFKIQMGTSFKFNAINGQQWSATQLSSEVLKDLKAAVRRRFDIDLENVVITVPAMFQQHQCAATKDAAVLAGLNAVTLVQEPIAAAAAYIGLDAEEGDYLVYDLGGGTFDVSVVRFRDGEMNVVTHGGDNYLGGRNFDKLIADWVRSELEHEGGVLLPKGDRKTEWLLLGACEEAKKDLSEVSVSSAKIDLSDLAIGVNSVPIEKHQYESLIEELVTKTIITARNRLAEAGISAQSIRKILVVGGPTHTHYIRERLKSELGIALDHSQDPMTVVADGAAVLASTILSPIPTGSRTTTEGVVFDLHYDPVSAELETVVSGRAVSTATFQGEIFIGSVSKDWDSGWLPLNGGAFATTVKLNAGTKTEFLFELRDINGTRIEVQPSRFAIRHGVRPAGAVSPHNYSVVLSDGTSASLIAAGTPLPTFGDGDFFAVNSISAGTDESLKIYFVEGGSAIANDNITIGEIVVSGQDIPRTLKEGTKLQITLNIDESLSLKARVFAPSLNKEWPVAFSAGAWRQKQSDLIASLGEAVTLMEDIEDHIPPDEQDKILRCGRDIEYAEKLLDEYAEETSHEIAHKISKIKEGLRPLEKSYGLNAMFARIEWRCDRVIELCSEQGDAPGRAHAEELLHDAHKCLELNDRDARDALAQIDERSRDLYFDHAMRTKEFWREQLLYFRGRAPQASNQIQYHESLRSAERSFSENDLRGTHMYLIQALQYLPSREQIRNRFFDAGIRNA